MVSQAQLDIVGRYIAKGEEEGARLAYGGKRLDRPGNFLEPTVFADVTEDMEIFQEEIFGPVVCIIAFETEDEAIDIANRKRGREEVLPRPQCRGRVTKSAVTIEKKINGFRNKLRSQHVHDIESEKYSYQIGTLYKDIFSESEKIGDYIYDVTMSIVDAAE